MKTTFPLDQKNRKILYHLDKDSRQPISILAKRAGLSRDVVKYRINNLIKAGIISQFYSIIDVSKLGYSVHKNYVRFQNLTEQKEKEFIDFLAKHPSVVYSASYDGKYDFVFSLLAKNIEELSKKLGDIENKFGEYFAELETSSIIKAEYFPRELLLGSKERKLLSKRSGFGPIPSGESGRRFDLDDTSKKILVFLGQNSRYPRAEMAQKLGISVDSVYQRIRKLEHAKIISGYNLVLDNAKLGQSHYKLLIKLHNLSEKRAKALWQYCRMLPNCFYACSTLGAGNFEMNIEVWNTSEFREILRHLKNSFSDIIKDYSVLTLYRAHKYNFCPSEP